MRSYTSKRGGKGMNPTYSIQQRDKDISHALPILKDRLYIMTTRYRPHNTESLYFFSTDNMLRYEPFFVDFGPLNLAALYKFCTMLRHKLQDPRLKNHRIYYYCDKDPQRIANSTYLMGCFEVLELNRHPQEAYKLIRPLASKAVPFRDASMGICTYRCLVEHCLWAAYRAKQRNFLNIRTFNLEEYEHYERVECGDLNVIIPGKFIAFAGPNATEIDADGYPALTPDFYLPIWKKYRVTTIIRLNKKCYDKRIFTRAGYDHYDLYYTDGTCPNRSILKKFIEICEKAKGVVAVHCKAGLGRTGSCIGCYCMKHYGWRAQEIIAWLRMCRPGSVIGPQQHFLEEQQPIMWKEGREYRRKLGLDPDPESSLQKSFHDMSLQPQSEYENQSKSALNSRKPLATDPGQDQGRALINAKRRHTPSASASPTGSPTRVHDPSQETKTPSRRFFSSTSKLKEKLKSSFKHNKDEKIQSTPDN